MRFLPVSLGARECVLFQGLYQSWSRKLLNLRISFYGPGKLENLIVGHEKSQPDSQTSEVRLSRSLR